MSMFGPDGDRLCSFEELRAKANKDLEAMAAAGKKGRVTEIASKEPEKPKMGGLFEDPEWGRPIGAGDL